ncbi:NUDIX hydrolase [Microtetraspora fusca]|uniref:NUDIX hydrolase n=1 Tax=Microtetraspora fusca TaxID=1997 RepID=A0ABW6VE15_MICFU
MNGTTKKKCDHMSVGVILRRLFDGRYLTFDRNTPPPGKAAVAGHLDGDSFIQAALKEAREEVGVPLKVRDLTAVTPEPTWRPGQCRRDQGGQLGHTWMVYYAEVNAPDVKPSRRETRNVQWVTEDELHDAFLRTLKCSLGAITAAEFTAEPGLEPVWARWLRMAGAIRASERDLAQIDNLLNLPLAAWYTAD